MKKLMVLLITCSLLVLKNYAQEEENKEKPSAIEQFNNQVKVCTAVLELKDEKNKPIVNANTQHSLIRYMQNIQRYFEQKKFYNIESQMDSMLGYQVPDAVSQELKALSKTVYALISEEKDRMVKEGNDLYQKVIDSTKKNMDQDEIDLLRDNLQASRQEMGNAFSDDGAIRRVREKLEKASTFLNYWGPITSAQTTGDYSQALDKLESLINSYSSYSILPMKDLRAKTEVLRRETFKLYDAEIAALRKEFLQAEDAESVKKVLNKFQVFQSKFSSGMRNTTRYNDMNYAQQALGYWMNVMTFEESGDFQQAIQNMNNLESGYYRNTALLKWPEIKAKKEALVKKMLTAPKTDDPIVKAVDEQIKECKNIKDLIAFKTKLQELANNYSSTRIQELYYLQNDLQSLATMNDAFESGQYSQVFQLGLSQGQQSHRWQDLIRKQRELIRIKTVAAMVDIEDKELLKPDISAGKVLLAMADTAAEKQEWQKVVMLLDAYGQAFFPNYQRPVWLNGEINGCRSFITAQNYEKAGLLAQAVQQYTFVLQQNGKRLPTKKAIERLQALKESNPDLFNGPIAFPPEAAVMPENQRIDEELKDTEETQPAGVGLKLNKNSHHPAKQGRE